MALVFLVWPRITKEAAEAGEKSEKFAFDPDSIPEIPALIINTRRGEDPTYEKAIKPEEYCLGETITNNDYITGELELRHNKKTVFTDRMKIRVRGNTSSINYDKKAYKIRFKESIDLSGCGQSNKEWDLLNNGHNLNTCIGNYLSRRCSSEWNPEAVFVNLVLNGDYKGCYYLTEAVNFEAAHGLVEGNGYIFENDAYWWNANEVYFRLKGQTPQLAYTVKYPEIRRADNKKLQRLQTHLQELEDLILAGDEGYQEYLDTDSIVNWIMVRDVMGTLDDAGSNMFFYIRDFNEKFPTANKIKSGPLWDFDSCYQTEGMRSQYWYGAVYYFNELNAMASFKDTYSRRWKEVSKTLYADLENCLDELEGKYGHALDESWKLDGERWQVERADFNIEKNRALDWFRNRIVWMDENI